MMPLSTTAADPHQHHHWWKVDYRTTPSTSSTITSSVQGITTAVHKANNVKTTATTETDTSSMAATLADSDSKAIQSHRDSRMEHEMSGKNTNTTTTATAATGKIFVTAATGYSVVRNTTWTLEIVYHIHAMSLYNNNNDRNTNNPHPPPQQQQQQQQQQRCVEQWSLQRTAG